ASRIVVSTGPNQKYPSFAVSQSCIGSLPASSLTVSEARQASRFGGLFWEYEVDPRNPFTRTREYLRGRCTEVLKASSPTRPEVEPPVTTTSVSSPTTS